VFEKYTMGCHLGFELGEVDVPPSCESMAPTLYADASVWR